jgi:hypothetical protein
MNAQVNPSLKKQTEAFGLKPGSDMPLHSGMRVMTGLQAGAYRCRDCAGTVNGTQMSQASCVYCQLA